MFSADGCADDECDVLIPAVVMGGVDVAGDVFTDVAEPVVLDLFLPTSDKSTRDE